MTLAAVTWHRTEAADAMRRIAALRQMPPARPVGALRRLAQTRPAPVLRLLPDDRSTRGYWPPGYGSEYYVLCAQQFVADHVGGAGPRLRYDVRTTDPKEPGRFWVSKKSETDLAALWDPERRIHVSANRDDHGEQCPLGKGPDLLVECAIPAGNHVLSLYFVNDYNYYEPKRAYPLSATDVGGRLLCVTQVRDFGGGVYKRFAVHGPATLTFRAWRSVSLNVLLSGIFLDSITPPRAAPTCLGGPEQASRRLASIYARAAESMATDGFDIPVAEMARLAEELDATATAATARKRAGVWWMASECHRILGQSARAEAAFDRLVAAAPEAAPADPPWRTLEALARDLCAGQRAVPESLRWFREGTHRLDRVWSALFETWAAADATHKARLQLEAVRIAQSSDAHVTAWARERAYGFLDGAPEQKSLDGALLYDTGQGLAKQGQHEAAGTYLKRALAAQPDALITERILTDLIRTQVLSGAPAAEVEANYRELDRRAVNRGLVSASALQVAQAYARARDFRQAITWLDRAQELGGPATVIDAQRRRWQQQVKQQGGTGR